MQVSPQTIRIEDYTYDLPDHRIARYPLVRRDASKLLIWKNGRIQEDIYQNIGQYMEPDTLLVFNNTRVIPARLRFEKDTGGAVEIFCLEPEGELAGSMAQTGSSVWKCLVGGAKKWKSGLLTLENQGFKVSAEWVERGRETSLIRFSWTPESRSFAEVLEQMGQVPLPPYLQRPAEAEDRERYQTIYARYNGSVAAPTAGLHFTEELFQRLAEHNILPAYLTLHVGAGTFKPVKTETIGEHEMHAEYFDIDRATLARLRDQYGKGRVVAVGTTSLRTLESAFLMGCKLLVSPDMSLQELEIAQWDAYDARYPRVPAPEAFEALIQWLDKQGLERIVAKTQLLIAPGYSIQTVDALATNFHQPSSTLLLLVAALVGADWRKIYDYALGNEFRFLSFGDGSLLYRR